MSVKTRLNRLAKLGREREVESCAAAELRQRIEEARKRAEGRRPAPEAPVQLDGNQLAALAAARAAVEQAKRRGGPLAGLAEAIWLGRLKAQFALDAQDRRCG